MAPRRFFISVGSTGMKVLREFISRMIGEQLFKDEQYDTYQYIAIDSERSIVEEFNKLGIRFKTKRIKGILMDGGYAGGVGGNRMVSLRAVKCIEDTLTEINAFTHGLTPTDEFFVIGSAAGGTSSGLFLNLCERINYWVKNAIESEPLNHTIVVRAFLMLPDQAIAPGTMSDGTNYPTFPNMINLFQDIQCASWRRVLENEWRGFTVPITTVKNGNYYLLNDFEKVFGNDQPKKSFGVQNSTLPWMSIYPVPIFNKSIEQTIEHMAELMLLYSVINIDSGHGEAVNRFLRVLENRDNHEDCCFTGTSFVAYKSGYYPTLQKWFSDELGLANMDLNQEKPKTVEKDIKSIIESICYPGDKLEYAGLLTDPNIGPHLKNIDEQLSINWSNKDDFNQSFATIMQELNDLKDHIPSYSVFLAQQLIVLVIRVFQKRTDFSLKNLKGAYSTFYEDRKNLESDVNNTLLEFKNLGPNNISNLDAHIVSRATKELKAEEYLRNSSFVDFRNVFRENLKKYLRLKRKLMTPVNNPALLNKEIDEIFPKIINSLLLEINDRHDSGNVNVNPGPVEDLMKNPNYATIRKYLKIRPKEILGDLYYCDAQINSQSNEQMQFDAFMNNNQKLPSQVNRDAFELGKAPIPEGDSVELINRFRNEAIDDFINITDNKPGELAVIPNPLDDISIKRPLAKNEKSHANVFDESSTSVNAIPEHSNAFVVKLGKLPSNWDLSCDNLQSIGLTGMPGTSQRGDSYPNTNLLTDNPKNFGIVTNMVSTSDIHLFDSHEPPRRLRGLWMGKFHICYEGKHVLCNFPEPAREMWLSNPILNNRRSIYTITEMIKFGLIMRAIRKKADEEWSNFVANNGETVTLDGRIITINFGNSFEALRMSMNDAGFGLVLPAAGELSPSKLELPRMSVSFADTIWDIVRNPAFRILLPASIAALERDIFTQFRLHITSDEMEELEKLFNLLVRNTITVAIN